MPENAAKRAQVSFFTDYLISAVITRTHTPTQTHSVFPTHNAIKNALNTFFLNLLFFALYSFSLMTKHFLITFSGKLTTKKSEKATERRRKKIFFFVPLLVFGTITTYLFFQNSDLKCPKMPLSALKFHFLQITFFPP